MGTKKIPSDAKDPDLDWSQVRETVLMLNLALTQIERSMTEGDDSINALTKLFTTLIGKMQVINMASESLPESREKNAVMENCANVARKVNEVIVAFQFYDKLTQRLSHVCMSLAALGELISEPHRLYAPYEWKGLQEMIKSKYYIDADRQMFDALQNGATVREAMEVAEYYNRKGKTDENVELF